MKTNQFGKKGWTPERIASLKGKTFVITGTTSGTGFEATKILLSKGAKVVMLNRNPKKSENTIAKLKQEFGNDIDVSNIRMDLAEQASIKKAAEEVLKTVSKIDALICNGAIGQVAKQVHTVDGFESQLGVNYYGNFLLTNLLLDKIEQSNGRIVYVSSEGYKMGIKTIQFDDMNWDKNYHPNNVYAHSKLALMLFAYELQNRIAKANKKTKIYVCHPGSSKTSFIRKDAPFMTRIMFSIMVHLPIVQSAEKGSYPEVMCATEDNLKQKAFYGPTGTMQWVGPVGECKVENFVYDQEIAKRLWEVSEKATNCEWIF